MTFCQQQKDKAMTQVPVSVVIPCYGCADSIERAVASIKEQSKRPAEVILVDDASADDGATLRTLHALQKKHADKLQIEVISLKVNGGPAAARNAGWEAATQPYIAFLDADDSWHPKKLEIQYKWMQDMPEVAICGHLCEWEGISRERKHDKYDNNSKINYTMITKSGLLMRNAFSTPSVMLKRSLPLRFEEEKRHAEDYYLWLQAVCSGYRVARLDIPLASLYKAPYGEAGLSADLWAMEKGMQDVFCRLHQNGRLGAMKAWCFRLFSLVKYVRRVLVARSMARGRRTCR